MASENSHTRGVLLTGFGRKGRPTTAQLTTLVKLQHDLENYIGHSLALKGHKQVRANSECPGDLTDQWIGGAEDNVNKAAIADDLNMLWGYKEVIREAGQTLRSDLLLEAANAFEERINAIKKEVGV